MNPNESVTPFGVEQKGVKEKDLDLGRLCISLHRSRLVMVRQRQIMVDMVRDFAGPYWGAEWSASYREQPINLLALFVSVIGRNLISKDPRFALSIYDQKAKPAVAAMETWGNKEVRKLGLEKILERTVLNGLFSQGITKVSIASPGDSALFGYRIQPGQPYVWNIDNDDFVYDVHARDMAYCGYMGHRVRVPRDEVAKSKLYGKEDDLPASEDRLFNLEGDERISVLGRGMYSDNKEYEDMVDLWEIYLPRKKVVVTLKDEYLSGAALGKEGEYGARALRVQKWVGPECGPYHILSYITVPGNAHAKGPIQDIYDLHNAVNNVFRKLIRQAKRQKEVTVYSMANPEDAERLKKTNDGEFCGVNQPEKIQKLEMGGPNQMNHVLGLDMIQQASRLAGNLETMGGLSMQAKTAHQEAVLNKNSSGLLESMQEITVEHTSSVIKALCWYWHHHPSHVMKVEHTLKKHGLPDVSIMRHVGPGGLPQHPVTGQRWDEESGVGFHLTRDHDYDDMDIEVDPYSLQHKTPQQRLQAIMQVVTQVLMPMMPIAEKQGVSMDIHALLAKIAKWTDEPDLQEIVTYQEPPEESGGGGGGKEEQPGMPAQTERTYTRQNMPGRTPQGDQVNARNVLLGINQGGASNNGTSPVGA